MSPAVMAFPLTKCTRWNEVADSIMAYLRSSIYEAAKDDEVCIFLLAPFCTRGGVLCCNLVHLMHLHRLSCTPH